jgi:DNA-binding response OmpR family regulator
MAKVLLVDDDVQICAFVSMLLQLEGFNTQVAQTADGAMAFLATEQFDLILLDIAMPDVDGIELCRRIKGDPRTNRVPVLIVSARPGEEVIRKAKAAGADDFIRKPFENDELIAQIRRHAAQA